jgi:DNA-binding FadR family transcriptional regulator
MHHRAIFEQVQAANPDGARRAMYEHMIEAEETVRAALALRADRASTSSPE